jgi:putrescine importer
MSEKVFREPRGGKPLASTGPRGTNTPAAVPRLRRVLTLWDLIFYGLVLIQPIAAVPLFGVAQRLSRGHTATTVLAGMVAIMLTAFSYGRMAALYPAAGSAYTYVGRGLNPHAGFLAGWAMFLGYLMVPLINVIYVAVAVQREFPRIPYAAGGACFALLITLLNLRGIRWTALANQLLLGFMCAVIGVFIVEAIRFLFHLQGWRGVVSIKPFYDPRSFSLRSIATGTSFAALTYIGFDGVTTLAEDVENPRRNVLLATVLVVLFTGVFSGLQVYLAQLVWPEYQGFSSFETAFMDVCRRVGGALLFHAMWAVLIVASFGSALTGQVGAARILFGMSRDGVLPRRVFAYLDPRSNTPALNIGIIGLLAFAVALVLNYEQTAEILNSGALLAFMGVNLATFWQFYTKSQRARFVADAVVPLLGFLSCFTIWLSLPRPAMIIGGSWTLTGLALAMITTRGFRNRPALIDFGES